jgi:hypothetical protein
MRVISLVAAVLVALSCGSAAATRKNSKQWPLFFQNYTWAMKAWGNANDPVAGAMVVDVDIDEQKDLIKPLRDAGHIVVCYFSIGTMEPWRPDVQHNKSAWESACVNKMKHWDECWLNIMKPQLLKDLQSPRFHRAVAEGCHAIEPDNIDCYANQACYQGMGLTSAQAKPYQVRRSISINTGSVCVILSCCLLPAFDLSTLDLTCIFRRP